MDENRAEKRNEEKLQKVTLTQDVLWGTTKYKEGQQIIPDRQFHKYLKKHCLIKEMDKPKLGEIEPDVRTRTITPKTFTNDKMT